MTQENKQKILLNLPNTCTLMNAICGIIALLIAVFYHTPETIKISCFLIALGGFFDGIDGKLAKKYNVISELGKQLDSFADSITFVITPSCVFLSLHMVVNCNKVYLHEIIIVTFYICCGVFRLARYNITEQKPYFEGLPTTSAGVLMSIYIFISVIYMDKIIESMVYSIVSFIFIIILGIAMISKFQVNRI
ncbi:MAG: CDP-alcohol phosphatidyltransferase family protein [Eubacteriales bacterium]